MPPGVILDIDGTLVDSNYQHALAWALAFRDAGAEVPVWQCHRHIGMGGDKLVAAIAGNDVEEERGDLIREREPDHYKAILDTVVPLGGATELLDALQRHDREVVLASSAKDWEVEHYLDLLDARDRIAAWTSSADVDDTKPDPELVEVALAKLSADSRNGAVMIGDSVWDCEAAARAGIASVGVLSGGFSERELREAGATAVLHGPAEVARSLDGGPLRALLGIDPDATA